MVPYNKMSVAILIALLVVPLVILLVTYAFKTLYNYGVVNGASLDPLSQKPRLSAINMKQSLAIMVLVSVFIAPSCYRTSCA